MEAYCPCCSVVTKLYKSGSQSDKQEATRFKRKEKFISNIFVVHDPRDQDKDEDKKITGTVKIFEFATKLESNIRVGIFDAENGVLDAGFDPSEKGINFVIRVTETKPQDDGKKWPDYATSAFARNASTIADTEEEIDAIMAAVVNLDEYLQKQVVEESKIIEDLKSEQVFDLISDEYAKVIAKREVTAGKSTVKSVKSENEDKTEVSDEVVKEVVKEENTTKVEKPKQASPEDLDAELLAELSAM